MITAARPRLTANAVRDILDHVHACNDAREWFARSHLRPDRAWRSCNRGDWMIWLAARIGVDRPTVVLAVCACVRQALSVVPPEEDRPRIALETAERWARGDATLEDVSTASDAALQAAELPHSDEADIAACAAYDAAEVASGDPSDAATCAAEAVTAAEDAEGSRASIARSARIVRRMIPWPIVRDRLIETLAAVRATRQKGAGQE